MDTEHNPLLTWAYYCHGKSMEELRQSLLLTNLELETTRLKAQEELRIRENHLNHLKLLLAEAIKERNQAQENYQKLFFDKILLQNCQKTAPTSGISSIEDEPRRGIDSNNGFSSSDCEESIVSSPEIDPIAPPPLLQPPSSVEELGIPVVVDKPLPEKGKLLEAVMRAGPLLQTLLVAGPLPQWRHPPPPLDACQIPPPPAAVPPPAPLVLQDSDDFGGINRKRGCFEGSVSPTETKYQRIVLN